MRSPVNHVLPLAALLLAGGVAIAKPNKAPPPATGPAADYPVVLGDSFTVGTQTYTPEDRLSYDEVGQAAIGTDGGDRISAAHRTLPLPSYVEVTSLTSGRTILVRVERRGPMSNETLIELSSGAAAQLGLTDGTAVRVRRVNPPEPERALLRAGQHAPERMATPKGLLDALNRKLQRQGPARLVQAPSTAPVSPPKPVKALPAAKPNPTVAPVPRPTPAVAPAPVTKAEPKPAADALVVQVAALSVRQRADAVAAKLGASVSPAGRFWRIRLGPFTSRAAAEAALAKAKGAGYSDARILRAD